MSGCGSGGQQADTSGKYVFPSALPADAPETALTVNADDQMRYDQEELKAKSGTRIKLTLNHTGVITKAAGGHNIVILKQETDLADYARRAVAASGTGYIPEGDEAIAYTRMIGGGESTTISFDAPAPGV